jgi:hypothetical protein
MQFDEFTRLVDTAIHETATIDRYDARENGKAAWSTRSRTAVVALVPPLNVSVSLDGPAGSAQTTWYPIDAALVAVVSGRIASFLSKA